MLKNYEEWHISLFGIVNNLFYPKLQGNMNFVPSDEE